MAPFVVRFRGEEILITVGFAIGMLGFSGFSFYRGLMVRKRSFWRRNAKPFLLTLFGSGAGISLACLILGTIFGAFGHNREEEIVVCLVMTTVFAFAFGFVLFVEFLFTRWEASLATVDASVPPHERPVPIAWRALDLLLAVPCLIGAIACFVAGLMERRSMDQFGCFVGSIILAALTFFFSRQALRRKRGHLYTGTVRPFLLTVVGATLPICILPFLLPLNMREEQVMILIVTGSIAVGISVAMALLRRPRPLAED